MPAALTARPAYVAPAPVRVTHVVFDLHGGGMESLLLAMARRLHGSPVELSVITLGGREGRVGAEMRPLLRHLTVLRPRRGISLVYPREVADAIRATRADVVHIHSGCWLKGALAAKLAGVPTVVFTEHGREHDDPWHVRLQDRLAAALTTWVVPVSRRLDGYMHAAVGVPRAKLRLVENGIDLARFTPGPASSALRAELRLPPEALVIGSIGRFERVKGYDRLLDTFRMALASERPERPRYLVLWGDGTERAALERQAAALGIAERVRFPGWTQAAWDAYRLMDVFVLTSRSEGLSVSLLEALACERAVLVNDVGGNATLLGDGPLREQVLPDGDWDRFAGRLGALLEAPEARARLGAAGRRRVAEAFSLDRVIDEYLELYGAPAGVALAARD